MDLNSGINNFFFSSQLQRNIRIHFEIIASLGDQPERREINYLAGGNSKFGARYLYAANMEELMDVLPPCTTCLTKLQKEPHFFATNQNFKCCLKRDIMANSDIGKYSPPTDYPKNILP